MRFWRRIAQHRPSSGIRRSGSRTLRTPLIFARIWTDVAWDSGRPIHGYVVHDADNRVIARGCVPKERSGHRNPLRLLHRVLASIDLDALPNDHVETVWDRLPGAEAEAAARRDRIARARDDVLDRLGFLEQAGGEGQAALASIAAEVDRLRGRPDDDDGQPG